MYKHPGPGPTWKNVQKSKNEKSEKIEYHLSLVIPKIKKISEDKKFHEEDDYSKAYLSFKNQEMNMEMY